MYLQVRHLVRRDVVLHELRRHHQPPTERQRAVDRATAPAAARVLHRDAPRRHAECRGLGDHQLGQPPQCLGAQEIRDAAPQEFRRAADMQLAVLQPCTAARLRHMTDAMRNIADRHQRTIGERQCIRQRGQSARHPFRVVHQQCNAGTASRAHRQRDDNAAAAGIDAQTDASRATIASPFDPRRPAGKRQHFRSRQFHSAHKGQIGPIRQPCSIAGCSAVIARQRSNAAISMGACSARSQCGRCARCARYAACASCTPHASNAANNLACCSPVSFRCGGRM